MKTSALLLLLATCVFATDACRQEDDVAKYRVEDPPFERQRALWQLDDDDPDKALATLSLALRSDPDADVREAAALQLGDLRREEAIEPLAVAAATDPGEFVPLAATEALGRIGGPVAARRLVGLWRDGDLSIDDHALNQGVSFALEDIGEEALPFVRDALDAEKPRIRREAARLLGDIGTAEDIPRLEEMTASSNYFVASHARRGLDNLRERLDK